MNDIIYYDQLSARNCLDYTTPVGSRVQAWELTPMPGIFVGMLLAGTKKWAYWTDTCTLQELAERLLGNYDISDETELSV